MPTSVPGSRGFAPSAGRHAGSACAAGHARRGFTLLELLLVLVIVAVSAGLATLALRDSRVTQLEREAVRLAALLEMGRAESRVTGTAVRWVPAGTDTPGASRADDGMAPVGFQFTGLSRQAPLPTQWLDPRVTALVAAPGFLQLGPDAILPRQRVLLRLEDQQIEVGSDGLGPFEVAAGVENPP